ncbi:hypothetical protein C0992_009461 [Termitomyces sp. T32_za158]|nr:hypothetical protein C0992_009461 [Termitomyces sp. T32_za158]
MSIQQDKRWSIKNVRISGEIADFKARLDDASKIFQNRSIIVISGGLDAILQKLGTLLNSFDRISRTLKDIQHIQQEHYETIIAELRDKREAEERRKFLETVLDPQTAKKVGYDQQEKIPCDEDTRNEVLADIRAWINDISYGSKNFLWLTGDPGCGKSAVTASVARECKDRKILRAQFFINRNNDETTNPNHYFPTLALQLAKYSETVERQIFNTLRERSSLLDSISREQVTKFFLDVLGAAAVVDSKVPVVVVIDGLDETRRDKLEETAIIISTLFNALPSYPNIKIFISSRTEHGIQKPFSRAIGDRRVKDIYLDTNSESSRRDVETYLRKRFSWIAERFGYNANIWPGEERLRSLATHASGHFIWAVTVTKFLEEQIDEWGLERLDTVMSNLAMIEGRRDVKALYGDILSLTYPRSTDPWAFETFRRVVGFVATSLEPLSLSRLEALLDLRRDPHSLPVDLTHLVRRLRTVLVAGTGDITGETMLRLHNSFFEYVTSEDCDVRFRVSLEASNAELAFQCLYHITKAYSDIRDTHSDISTTVSLPNSSQVRYSLRFCASHFLRRGKNPLSTLIDDPAIDPFQLNAMIHHSPEVDGCPGPLTLRYLADSMFTFLDGHGLRWRTRDGWLSPELSPSLKSRREILCSQISPAGTKVAVALSSLSSLGLKRKLKVFDAETLLHLYSVPLPHNAKSLVFSPDGKHISVLTTESIVQIHVDTGKTNITNPGLKLHMDTSIICSPNGDLHLISRRSPSVLVRSRIGGFRETIEMPHGVECKFMVVSRDCAQIVTITQDGVHIWDFDSGDLVHTFSSDFAIWSAALSPNKEIVICSDSVGTVFIWKINDVSQSWRKLCDIDTSLQGHHYRYFTRRTEAWLHLDIDHLDFSADGDFIVATSHGIAQLVEIRSGRGTTLHYYRELQSRFSRFSHHSIEGEGETQSIQCPIFSLDGKHVFLFDKHRIVKHVLPSYQSEETPLQVVEWSSFSPDGKFLISAVLTGGLRLCDLRTGRTDCLPFPQDTADVRIACAAFSPDGSLIVGTSVFGDVCMWNTAHHGIIGVSEQPIMDVGSISFGTHGEIILLASRENTIAARLILVNGILKRLVAGFDDLPDEHDEDDHDAGLNGRRRVGTRCFDADTAGYIYSSETAPNTRLNELRWFSGPSDVFYAYVNNHIVRGGADGTFVVVPVNARQHDN